MNCILYIQINNDTIPEMDLYQIYFNLYKKNTSNKEILIIRARKNPENENVYIVNKTIRSKDPITKDDKLITLKEEIDINDIDDYAKNLEEKYEVYNLILEFGKDVILHNYIDRVITINKEEFVTPL